MRSLRELRDENREVKDWPGASIYVCAGRFAGFGHRVDGDVFRLTLGWVVIGLALIDIERFWGAIAQQLAKDAEVAE